MSQVIDGMTEMFLSFMKAELCFANLYALANVPMHTGILETVF